MAKVKQSDEERAEALAKAKFTQLRGFAKMAQDIFGQVTEDAVFGLYERIDGNEDVMDDIIQDIERSKEIAKELFGTVTPAGTFEVFDIAFVGDQD